MLFLDSLLITPLIAPDFLLHGWVEDVHYLSILLLLSLCLSATAYYGYAIYAAQKFFAQPRSIDPDFHPPISILKPVCGLDRNTYENLASFCCQDYPLFQIIFGVQDWSDSSVPVIRQIIHDFPTVDIQLVINDRTIGANRKVSNLANAVAKAKYEILIFSDSDVCVQPDYLQHTIQPFRESQVGVVTCLYRAATEGWLTSLEALSSATEFLPGVLVSNHLEGTKFAMGQTIVMRRSVLEEIGGFAAIADYLADDFQLGHLPTQAGYQVVLSPYLIDHVMTSIALKGSLQRQLRWMVGIRVSRWWGYAGLVFTYGTVSSLLFLLTTGGSVVSWLVLGIVWTSRLGMAWFIGVRSLNDPIARRLFWLVPLRDCISFALWCYGFFGDRVEWRGRQFKLMRHGELVACPSKLPRRVKSMPS